MRGLIKVAALLSSVLSSGLVIPSTQGNGLSLKSFPPVNPSGSEAAVKLAVDDLDSSRQNRAFQFHVSGTEKPCGQSDVQINGQRLDFQWNGVEAHGRGYLDLPTKQEAFWSILCIHAPVPDGTPVEDDQDVVHLFRLRFEETSSSHPSSGFTISYRPLQTQFIIRLSPEIVDDETIRQEATAWLTESSSKSSPSPPDSIIDELGPESTVSGQGWETQERLFKSFGRIIKDKIGKVVKSIGSCQKFLSAVRPVRTKPFDTISQQEPEETTPTVNNADPTTTIPSVVAAETRSLSILEDPTPSSVSTPIEDDEATQPRTIAKPLKIAAISLVILCILALSVSRCKDPRWRADRAARREERRTKRLYRRAAQRQKIKNWIWNLRIKYRLLATEILNSNEKQTRVTDQEEILENVTEGDIRALRHANRVVSNVTAAEEGRNYFEFETESSSRRRSVSTLPGYESDGTQPPSYDDAGRSYDGSTLVEASGFTPVGTYSDPDSSVVSTSPRISRDGTNSDFDEKIEAMSLDPRGTAFTY